MKLGKMFFVLLFSSFVGIVANPELPFASDSVVITGISNSGVTDTTPLPEAALEESTQVGTSDVAPEQTETTYYEPVQNEPVYVELTYEEPVYYVPSNNISINGQTIGLNYTNTTGENAGGATLAWYYKSEKFIYGHNSWNVFGFLNTAYDGGWLIGMPFSVTMDGVTQYYTVENYRLYDYDGEKLWHEGVSTKMNPIVKAKLDGTSYRMAIMTCYAGGSKRLVVFAN